MDGPTRPTYFPSPPNWGVLISSHCFYWHVSPQVQLSLSVFIPHTVWADISLSPSTSSTPTLSVTVGVLNSCCSNLDGKWKTLMQNGSAMCLQTWEIKHKYFSGQTSLAENAEKKKKKLFASWSCRCQDWPPSGFLSGKIKMTKPNNLHSLHPVPRDIKPEVIEIRILDTLVTTVTSHCMQRSQLTSVVYLRSNTALYHSFEWWSHLCIRILKHRSSWQTVNHDVYYFHL